MRTLADLIPRNLVTRKARTSLTALGIALGVAAIVATGVVQESATRSVADMFDHAAGRADLVVTNALVGIVGGQGFDETAREQVQAVEGVEMTAPLLQITTLPSAQLDDWEYSFIFGNFDGAVLYGVDPAANRELGHYNIAVGEDLPAMGESGILLTESYARTLGVGLGDDVEFAAPTGQVRFTVRGLLASIGLARLNRGQVGVLGLDAAQRIFDRDGRLDQIDVVADPGTKVDELQQRLRAMLGEGYQVSRPANKGALVEQMLQTVTGGMGFIGTLALVVGGFLIYNTFSMTVAERTHELGLLRALGAGRGQTVGLVLAEAASLGLTGASLGVPLGLGLAVGMQRLAATAVNSDLNELVILPEHVVAGLVVGVLIALIAGLAPALWAGRVSIVDAIQLRRQKDERASNWQIIIGSLLTVLGLAITFSYAMNPFDVPFEFAFLTLIALLIGTGLLIPLAIPRLEHLAGTVLGLTGVEGWLGGRNLARSPGRAALTAGALMFGLASVIVIGGVFSSAKGMTQNYMEKTLAAELWLYAPQRLPRSLSEELEALPEVELARPAATIPTRLLPPDPAQSEVAVIFTAIDPLRSKQLDFFLTPDGGEQDEAIARLLDGGAVFIASPLQEWYGFDVGDNIRLQTIEGPTDFTVAGVTFNLTASGYSVTGIYDDAVRYFDTDQADIFAINLLPNADPEEVGRSILNRWGESYNLKIETADDFQRRSQQLSDSFAALSDTAVLLGVVVAALGVVNTLMMNVFERRREIGVLRSLGMTQGQIVRLILAESAAMGALGGLLGVTLGVWLSRFAVSSSGSMTGYDFPYVFPTQAIATCIAIALVVPLVAGLWPAWRGARANVVQAMRSE